MNERALRVGLGLFVAAACLWLVSRSVRLDSLKYALKTIDAPWVGAAISAFVVGYASRIERWRQMLIYENAQLRWIECAGPFFASYAANNLLPLRAGDVLRAFAFNRTLGASSGAVVATLFVERLLDMLVLIALLSGALAFFGSAVSRFHSAGIVALSIAAAAIVLVFLFPRAVGRLALTVGSGIRRVSPKFGERVLREIQNGLVALIRLTAGRSAIKMLFLSIFIWICEGCIFWFSALAMPALHFPSASWLALPAGTLATLLPSTPGFVGTFEYSVVLAMSTLGNTGSAAAAYAILVHGLLALPSVLIGGMYLLIHPYRRHGELAEI